jgi:hypothetical protein
MMDPLGMTVPSTLIRRKVKESSRTVEFNGVICKVRNCQRTYTFESLRFFPTGVNVWNFVDIIWVLFVDFHVRINFLMTLLLDYSKELEDEGFRIFYWRSMSLLYPTHCVGYRRDTDLQ